jgi:hypothetical protein
MKNEMIMMGDTATITAVNAADRVNKLRQILLGAVKIPETGRRVRVIDHKPRLKVLLEMHRAGRGQVDRDRAVQGHRARAG